MGFDDAGLAARDRNFVQAACAIAQTAAMLAIRSLFVRFQHCRSNFAAARPVSASLAGMGSITIQIRGVGLRDLAVQQEKQPRLGGGHQSDEGLRLAQEFS